MRGNQFLFMNKEINQKEDLGRFPGENLGRLSIEQKKIINCCRAIADLAELPREKLIGIDFHKAKISLNPFSANFGSANVNKLEELAKGQADDKSKPNEFELLEIFQEMSGEIKQGKQRKGKYQLSSKEKDNVHNAALLLETITHHHFDEELTTIEFQVKQAIRKGEESGEGVSILGIKSVSKDNNLIQFNYPFSLDFKMLIIKAAITLQTSSWKTENREDRWWASNVIIPTKNCLGKIESEPVYLSNEWDEIIKKMPFAGLRRRKKDPPGSGRKPGSERGLRKKRRRGKPGVQIKE